MITLVFDSVLCVFNIAPHHLRRAKTAGQKDRPFCRPTAKFVEVFVLLWTIALLSNDDKSALLRLLLVLFTACVENGGCLKERKKTKD